MTGKKQHFMELIRYSIKITSLKKYEHTAWDSYMGY